MPGRSSLLGRLEGPDKPLRANAYGVKEDLEQTPGVDQVLAFGLQAPGCWWTSAYRALTGGREDRLGMDFSTVPTFFVVPVLIPQLHALAGGGRPLTAAPRARSWG